MQSHDFASTYVGTPFYMSPEICAAERYTLHSDIWSLGCIIYELCAKEPPFNAKTHFHLVQKIKEGKLPPLPSVYSPELQSVIRSCLKVNPKLRPDTAQLLNLPVVKLMRKEREVVELGRLLKCKEETVARRAKELDERASHMDAEREKLRRDVDASVRREWEVKARLEIDRQVKVEVERQVKSELERLSHAVEASFENRVRQEAQRQLQTLDNAQNSNSDHGNLAETTDIPQSSRQYKRRDGLPLDDGSVGAFAQLAGGIAGQKGRNRRETPFARSRTVMDESPMDIQMVDPSPMSIASLSLSPRRTAPRGTGKNIFAAANEVKPRELPAAF